MALTLWIYTRVGQNISPDSDDHNWMAELLDSLDEVCAERGVRLLSQYLTVLDEDVDDDIDENFNPDEDADETYDADFEDLPLGIESVAWSNAKDGLRTMTAIREAVQAGAIAEQDCEVPELVAELSDCIEKVSRAVKQRGEFLLTLVE